MPRRQDERARFLEELLGGMAQRMAQAVGDAVRAEMHRPAGAAEGPGVWFLAR
jgi:hypothetical protein